MAAFGGRSMPQYSQFGRSSSAIVTSIAALSGGLSANQLTAIETHLRKAASIIGRCHAGMALKQTPEVSDILMANF